MSRLALFVDPRRSFTTRLEQIARRAGWNVESRASFEEARVDIAAWAPALVVTHLRLGAFNGIHLVYLAKMANPAVTCVVFDEVESSLGAEAQHAGAFFERRAYLPFSLTRYLTSTLPPTDRRNPQRVDRRAAFRGGRRSTDLDFLHRDRAPSSQ
jgi:DNA-binding NtrC family response regulator